MGIHVGAAHSQASTLSHHASTLREVENSLNLFKSNLSSAWQGDEMKYIHIAIDQITANIRSVSSQLDAIGSDISSVAEEIRREEEAREAAAREAAAREAAAREAAKKIPLKNNGLGFRGM